MKKLNKFRIVTVIFIMVASLFTACEISENDDSNGSGIGNGTATLDGKTSTFSQGLITYYGIYENSEFHNFDISLGSSGINPVNQTGIGDALRLELLVSSSTFSGGNFVYSDSVSTNALISGYYLLDVNVSTEEAEIMYVVTGGILNISKEGNEYELDYSFTVQELNTMFYLPVGEAKTLTGDYSGELIYDDASDKKKSKAILGSFK